MADDQDPLDDDQDPDTDTPDEPVEDTDADDTPDPKSPEERQKEAQRTITRLSQENARLRAAQEAEPDDEPDEPSDDFSAKFETESWALAEATYGPEAIAAYEAAQKLGVPQSPADWVGTFEAYHQARLNGGKAPAKASARSKADLEPRETDLDPDLQKLDKQISEARKGGKLDEFAAAAVARMGLGGKS